MTKRHRIIPVLLLKDGGLYKTTKFGKPSYVGDPINAVKIFNEKEVDEQVKRVAQSAQSFKEKKGKAADGDRERESADFEHG